MQVKLCMKMFRCFNGNGLIPGSGVLLIPKIMFNVNLTLSIGMRRVAWIHTEVLDRRFLSQPGLLAHGVALIQVDWGE